MFGQETSCMVVSAFEGILVSEGASGQLATASGRNSVPRITLAGIHTAAGFTPALDTRDSRAESPLIRTVGIGAKHAYLTFAKHPFK
jgi:hypothetical protein